MQSWQILGKSNEHLAIVAVKNAFFQLKISSHMQDDRPERVNLKSEDGFKPFHKTLIRHVKT